MRPMRFQSAVLAGLLCLFAGVASADITRISPSVIEFADSEASITIFGSDLTGSESTFVVFDDLYEVEASGSSTQISAFVPIDVTAFTGSHTLVVRSTDVGGGIRLHGPVSFTVETQQGGAEAPAADTGEGDGDSNTVPIVLGAIALVAALAALGIALGGRRRSPA